MGKVVSVLATIEGIGVIAAGVAIRGVDVEGTSGFDEAGGIVRDALAVAAVGVDVGGAGAEGVVASAAVGIGVGVDGGGDVADVGGIVGVAAVAAAVGNGVGIDGADGGNGACVVVNMAVAICWWWSGSHCC